MRKRGFGRKRSLVIAAIVLAISVAAPEMDAPAGAVVARSAARTQIAARPARAERAAAKRRDIAGDGHYRRSASSLQCRGHVGGLTGQKGQCTFPSLHAREFHGQLVGSQLEPLGSGRIQRRWSRW